MLESLNIVHRPGLETALSGRGYERERERAGDRSAATEAVF